MKTHIAKILVATICLASAMTSCNKNEPKLEPAQISSTEGVKVANGRLVFTTNEVFLQTTNTLWGKDDQELDRWENKYGFTSLRSTERSKAYAESDSTNEKSLMQEFMFPNSYATIISNSGEYQIGNTIYWFYKGRKYEAQSNEELSLIKNDPSIAKRSYFAGARLVSTKHAIENQKNSDHSYLTTNTTIRSGTTTNGDGKYHQSEFPLNGDNRSLRRANFETFIYNEDRTRYDGGAYSGYQAWYSAIVLNEYFEYYSFGTGRWYRAGESRATSFDLMVSGGVSGPSYYGSSPNTPTPFGCLGCFCYASAPGQSYPGSDYTSYPPQRTTLNNTSHTGDFRADFLQVTVYRQDHSSNQPDFTWRFDVNGTLSSYPVSDPNHAYTLSGTLW